MKAAESQTKDVWFVDDCTETAENPDIEKAIQLLKKITPRKAQRQIILLIEELAARSQARAKASEGENQAVPDAKLTAKSD